jgi:hypothetical protein
MEVTSARTFKETVVHYGELRKVAHEFTEAEYRQFSVRLREIRYDDAVEADRWSALWDDAAKVPIWTWTRMYRDYHGNSGIKRFDAALDVNGKLCALCYGVPSRRKLILKLHAIARLPENNPLEGKVLTIMLFAADAYARLLDAEELWICNPMNDRLVSLYEGAGYSVNSDRSGVVTHLSLRLKK